jgi:DNA-binding response OmpR family regulator
MKKKKILIVDDEEDILYLLRKFLEDENYEVIEAKGGPQCLTMVEKENPDLIILDILMPDLNGWEVCKTIKESESIPPVPITILSILGDTGHILTSRDYAHADMHVNKPIDFPELDKTIKTLLKSGAKGARKKSKPPTKGEPNFFAPFEFDSTPIN